MCVNFDREMKAYNVTQVIKQVINIKTMCPNYVLEFRNTNLYLLQVYLGRNCHWKSSLLTWKSYGVLAIS